MSYFYLINVIFFTILNKSRLRLISFKMVEQNAIKVRILSLIPISIMLYFLPSKMKLVRVTLK